MGVPSYCASFSSARALTKFGREELFGPFLRRQWCTADEVRLADHVIGRVTNRCVQKILLVECVP